MLQIRTTRMPCSVTSKQSMVLEEVFKAGDLFCEHPGGRVEMESASPVPCRKTRTTSTLPSGFCGCVNLQLAQRHCMLLLLNDQRKLKKPEGLSPTGFYLSVFRRLLLEQQRHVDLLTDPAHHRHGHRVAQGFISRPVGALICRLVAPGDGGVSGFKSLQFFRLDWQ